MRLEALETRIDDFDERNLVLQAMLGFASAVEKVDRVFARHVPAEVSVASDELQPEDALLVDFALGVLSFRQTIGSIMWAASSSPASADDPEVSDTQWMDRGVLR
jgi:hypothetical protein